jgi:transposase
MDRDVLHMLLTEGRSLAEIGRQVGLHESTVGYWVKKHGLVAANRDKHAARGGIARTQLEALVEEGMSIAQIAGRVGCGKATVRHWLCEHGLRTRRVELRREAIDSGADPRTSSRASVRTMV